MSKVTIGISSVENTKARMRRAFRGKEQGAFISFASPELLWKVITPKRWEVLRTMTGAGPIAHPRSRTPGRARREVRAWRRPGTAQGRRARPRRGWRNVLPYDEVHVDFVLSAA